jgi:ElaB/YqjD/DUF883 family membrane-anchored ribosome-binding protein
MATVNYAEGRSTACRWPTREAVEENLRQARRAVTAARHTGEDAIEQTALNIRRHPLQAVGAAAVVGAVAGAVIGFSVGWWKQHR